MHTHDSGDQALAPAPKLTHLLLALGAFALGLVGQHYLGGIRPAAKPTDGLLVYAAAIALFVAAQYHAGREQSRPPVFQLASLAERGWQYGLSIGLAFLAGVAMLFSLSMFGSGLETDVSWTLYLAAILLFLAAAYVLTSPRRTPAAERLSRQERIALLVILILGLGFRLYRFGDLPYGLWYDEADNGLAARQILYNPDYRPLYVPSTNLPAHFLHLVTFAFHLLGDSMYSIRAVAVVFGLLTIVAAYACGRELFAPPYRGALALAFAFLIAVSRWDVNWSRIGMHGVTLPFFELWVVAALLRGLRTGRITAFAWAGVALGLGMCFYSPFRIFPAILGLFGLAWFVRWLAGARRGQPSGRWLRQTMMTWATPALLVALGTLIAAAPVIQFSLHHSELFWERARRISVFQDPAVRDDPVAALWTSTVKHLLMFNYRGDPNGRHNLPGAPMLDQFSGVLLVMGVVLCAIRPTRPRSVLLLAWLLVSLSGGILSTWFEAPQSLRAIGSLPAAYALACLPLEWLAREWRRVFSPPGTGLALSRGLLVRAMAVLLAAVAVENALVYFGYWAHDFASWAAFNPAETQMAKDVLHYRGKYDLRFDPLLAAHLTTRYLAPGLSSYDHFDPATVFPLRETDKEGILLFISPQSEALLEQAKSLYPLVQVDPMLHPESSTPVMHRYFFSRDQIAETHGLDATYISLAGSPVAQESRVEPQLDLSWNDEPPVSYPFQATWTGSLLAPVYGTYTVSLEAEGEFLLDLDGQVLLSGTGQQSRTVRLAQGVHSLYLNCQVEGPDAVRLQWQPPGADAPNPVPGDVLYRAFWPVNGLVGRFYANGTWAGEPAFVRIDRQVAYYFHYLPLPRPYTVHWIGQLLAPTTGTYQFAVRAVSSASLYIDGQQLIAPSAPNERKEGQIHLRTGLHTIEVRFLDDQSHSQVYLYWQPPEGHWERVPAGYLFLPFEGAWWPAN